MPPIDEPSLESSTVPYGPGDSTLAGLCSLWTEKIKKAKEYKKKVFQDDADEGMRFFRPPDGTYDWVYSGDDRGSRWSASETTDPPIRMTLNKVAELVEIFGPILYAKNPIRQVNPRQPAQIPPTAIPDPFLYQYLMSQEQQRSQHDALKSQLISAYLNWTPSALHLKEHVKRGIEEALIKGRGCLSGGVEVYARTSAGEGPIRVRDLFQQKGEAWLWDGACWNRVVGVRQIEKSAGDLKITLRSGEEVNCTADHIWPTGRGNQHADNLVVGDVLKQVVLPEPEDSSAPEFIPDEVGWFVGLFLGDGNLSEGRKSRISIAGHIDEMDTRERVQRLVERYGGWLQVVTRAATKKADMQICCPLLVTLIGEFIAPGTAYAKHLTTACWKRSNVFLKNLLEGYLDADGHYVEKEEIWRLGFCNNKELADDLRILCGRLGLRITLKLLKNQNGSGEEYENYRGTIRTREPQFYKNGKQRGEDLQEIVAISKADWRCDFFYDVALENSPHTYALASGLLTHNCLWAGTWMPPGSNTTYVGSFYDTVDYLFIDPDTESLENAWWIARQVCQPVWQAERRFGLKKGSLKANHESVNQQVEVDSARKEFDRARGLTNDLINYYEIYSRMGCGGRLSGSRADRTDDLIPGDLSAFAAVLDPLVGDHCFLVVANGVPYPLNLPPDIQEIPVTQTGGPEDGGPVIKERLSWPVPFWEDGTWPVTCLDFHNVPRQAWPMSHIKPALGELRFLCWAYSFVACKIKNTLRDVVAVLKEMADNFKLTILEGADLSLVELDTNNRDIRECVQILQFPQMNADIWKIIQAVEANFEKRVGLDEARGHGMRDTQPRSATEVQAQQQAANIRPSDMAECVEEWMTMAARKEAIAARLLLAPKDVLPMLGLTSAALWATFVSTRDMGIMRELEYRIEAGSTRKPNRDKDQQNADSGFQILGPVLQGFAASQGQVGPLNALIDMWCRTRDLPSGPFQIQPPPPPPPMPLPGGPPPGGGGPPPGGGAAAAHNGAPAAHAGAAR